MSEIRTPFEIPDIVVKPALPISPRVSDDVQQTLATLLCYDGSARRLLRCTPRGMLQVVNPLIIGFINVGGLGANGVYDGLDIPCSEVIVRAHPDNSQRVWVNVFAAAAVDTGWALDRNEYIPLTLTNMLQLHLLIEDAGEQVIIAYMQ